MSNHGIDKGTTHMVNTQLELVLELSGIGRVFGGRLHDEEAVVVYWLLAQVEEVALV